MVIAWVQPIKTKPALCTRQPRATTDTSKMPHSCPCNGKSRWCTSEGSRIPSSNIPVNSRSKGHGGTPGLQAAAPSDGENPQPRQNTASETRSEPAALPGTTAPEPAAATGDVTKLWVLLQDTELVGLTQHKHNISDFAK